MTPLIFTDEKAWRVTVKLFGYEIDERHTPILWADANSTSFPRVVGCFNIERGYGELRNTPADPFDFKAWEGGR